MMKSIALLYVLLVSVVSTCFAGTLSFTVRSMTFNTPFDIPANAALGTVLQTLMYSQNLNFTGMQGCTVTKTSTVSGTPVPGFDGVYATNIPGIGIRFRSTKMLGGAMVFDPVNQDLVFSKDSGGAQLYTSAQLVVVGSIGSGTLQNLPTATYTFSSSCADVPAVAVQTVNSGTSISGVTSCSISSPTIAINLPTVGEGALKTAGDVAGTTNGNIPVRCASGTNVYVTFSDASDPGNVSNVLSLAPSSTAVNVGLQILYNGLPVSYGPDSSSFNNANQFLLGPSSTLSSIPIMVRYYSRGSAVAGVVRGVSTVTFSYQ
jgi:hypothetical protein